MTNRYMAAESRTMYFIGVTTGKSSINRVFPKWSEVLGLEAGLKGFDFEPNSDPLRYREAVEFIKNDPNSLGALVTTHKIHLYRASQDLFEGVDPYAQLLGEVSSISKHGKELWGHAKDPLSSGFSLEAIVDDGYWQRTGGEMLVLGAGGAALALTLYLFNRKKEGADVPIKIYVSDRSRQRIEEMRLIHHKICFDIPIRYSLVSTPEENDRIACALKPYSILVNATGLGKDRPGSPLTDTVIFPENGIAWDFNYRGDLVFLDQARSQQDQRNLKIVDGWVYFIHGWLRVIAEVFHVEIPTHGPEFEKLSQLAAQAAGG